MKKTFILLVAILSLTKGYSQNYNTATGMDALQSITTGIYNTADGAYALYSNMPGGYNTANGYKSLYSNTTGSQNTANGAYALYFDNTGFSNTANGTFALYSNSYGNYNTANGYGALSATTGSFFNTALGCNAGGSYDNGYNNVFLGAQTDVSGPDYYNVIAIGQGTTCTASSQVTIGNSATRSYRTYASWSIISDGRFKKNVQENVPGLAFINQLRPVTYTLDATGLDAFLHKNDKKRKLEKTAGRTASYDTTQINNNTNTFHTKALKEKETMTYTGFVAQDVAATAKKLGFNFSGIDAPKDSNDVYGLSYAEFVVPLVKAVQEQQQMIEGLKAENANQKNTNVDLQKQIDELKTLNKK